MNRKLFFFKLDMSVAHSLSKMEIFKRNVLSLLAIHYSVALLAMRLGGERLIIPQCSYEFGILALCSDCYSEAVATELYAVAVANDDAFFNKIVIYALSIRHLS